ncbi:MAG: adenine-specific methyltransferase EcoRI family protein, partial [Phycisphaerales bacterium]
GATDINDVKLFLDRNKAARTALKGNDQYPGGDFRSPECIAYLEKADIVVTNPPFSLFREYVAQLAAHEKKFLIIANKNAITYKEIFPLIKENKLWTGVAGFSGGMWFIADYQGKYEKVVDGIKLINVPAIWFTNLDHGRRRQPLECMTMEDNVRFNKKLKGKSYQRYANYDAIEVSFTNAIPSDYDGAMGVPITFLDKYNPEQFEIVGTSRTLATPMSEIAEKGTFQQGGPRFYVGNGDGTYRRLYDRIVIRHRTSKKRTKK